MELRSCSQMTWLAECISQDKTACSAVTKTKSLVAPRREESFSYSKKVLRELIGNHLLAMSS